MKKISAWLFDLAKYDLQYLLSIKVHSWLQTPFLFFLTVLMFLISLMHFKILLLLPVSENHHN